MAALLPISIAKALSAASIGDHGERADATGLFLLGWQTYLRFGELVQHHKAVLIVALKGVLGSCSLIVCPQERGHPTKTGCSSAPASKTTSSDSGNQFSAKKPDVLLSSRVTLCQRVVRLAVSRPFPVLVRLPIASPLSRRLRQEIKKNGDSRHPGMRGMRVWGKVGFSSAGDDKPALTRLDCLSAYPRMFKSYSPPALPRTSDGLGKRPIPSGRVSGSVWRERRSPQPFSAYRDSLLRRVSVSQDTVYHAISK